MIQHGFVHVGSYIKSQLSICHQPFEFPTLTTYQTENGKIVYNIIIWWAYKSIISGESQDKTTITISNIAWLTVYRNQIKLPLFSVHLQYI